MTTFLSSPCGLAWGYGFIVMMVLGFAAGLAMANNLKNKIKSIKNG